MDEDGSGTEKYGRTTQRADGRAKFAGVSLCKRGEFFFGERIDAAQRNAGAKGHLQSLACQAVRHE